MQPVSISCLIWISIPKFVIGYALGQALLEEVKVAQHTFCALFGFSTEASLSTRWTLCEKKISNNQSSKFKDIVSSLYVRRLENCWLQKIWND